MTQTKAESVSVTLTHHADAPVDRVFRAFTDAAELQRWFGPEGFVIDSAQMDARVGGEYRIAMRAPDGEVYTVKGVIRQLSEPDLIAYTWTWEEDDKAEEFESLVTIKFATAATGGTDIELVHAQLPSQESAERHTEGWTSSFNDLQRHLTT